jgi:hypothetical protein
MARCQNCRRQYDPEQSEARTFSQYCSPICEFPSEVETFIHTTDLAPQFEAPFSLTPTFTERKGKQGGLF